jgi:uncharacterized membrane protein
MILAHYYRAMTGRADIWRTRMDATSNWAIGATAAMVSFAMSNPASPHYVVFISAILTASFLFLEARRLTFYHLWQQRVLILERGLIRPAVAGEAGEQKGDTQLADELVPHLGRTVPVMRLRKAAARRLRRIYLYLFAVQLLAWSLKLSIHPTPAGSLREFIERAQTGPAPGLVVVVGAVSFIGLLAWVALRHGGVDRSQGEGPTANA